MTALVPASVCAAAVGRVWPGDLESQVRCIDEGARALGLSCCCPPLSHEARDPDEVTAGLARTPGALPVLGVVEGPASASLEQNDTDEHAADLQDRLDDASDAAVDRMRALSACGVQRIAVVEDLDGPPAGDDAVAEAHRPLHNAAAHLRLDLVLVARGLDAVEWLGYDRWASDRGCSPGLGFLPKSAFDSWALLGHGVDRIRAVGDLDEVISAPLGEGVSPDVVRHASRALLGETARP